MSYLKKSTGVKVLVILFAITTAQSSLAELGGGVDLDKSVICQDKRVESESNNGYINMSYGLYDTRIMKPFQTFVQTNLVPYMRSLCRNPKIKTTGDVIAHAQKQCFDMCKNTYHDYQDNKPSLNMDCYSLCNHGTGETYVMLSGYALAAQDFTGDAKATSCLTVVEGVVNKLSKNLAPIVTVPPSSGSAAGARQSGSTTVPPKVDP